MSFASSVIKDYGPIIAWLIPLTGWFVANRQANQRERRKEVRDEISEIGKKIDEVLICQKKILDLDSSDSDKSKIVILENAAIFMQIDAAIARLDRRYRNELSDWDDEKLLNLNDVIGKSTIFFNLCTEEHEDSFKEYEAARLWHKQCMAGNKLMDALHQSFIDAFK
ncbi:hypothetical protein K5M36_16860 [Chromobacterium vaccinii]|nr:hypothetical protein [Chromobacterium vaccinii]